VSGIERKNIFVALQISLDKKVDNKIKKRNK